MKRAKNLSLICIMMAVYILSVHCLINWDSPAHLARWLAPHLTHAHLWGFLINEIMCYCIAIILLLIITPWMKKSTSQQYKGHFSWRWWFYGLAVVEAVYRIFFPLATSVIEPLFASFGSKLGNNVFSSTIAHFNPVAIVLGGMVIAPIFEEIIFRGLIFNLLRVNGNYQAIIVSSFIFGFYHQNLNQFIYTVPLGLTLAYFYLKTDNLLVPICMHMMFNATGNMHLLTAFAWGKIFVLICLVLSLIGLVILGRWLWLHRKSRIHFNWSGLWKNPGIYCYLSVCLFYFFRV